MYYHKFFSNGKTAEKFIKKENNNRGVIYKLNSRNTKDDYMTEYYMARDEGENFTPEEMPFVVAWNDNPKPKPIKLR